MIRNLFSIVVMWVLAMMTHDNAFTQEAGIEVKELGSIRFLTPDGQDSFISKDPDMRLLTGKWKVVSVEVDGQHGPAQIGQQVGDIISIGKVGDHFQFG